VTNPSSQLLATHTNCLPVGARVSEFEILGLIGEGSFGIVYLAVDTSLERVVALKEFMPSAFAGRVDGVRVAVRSANHQPTFDAALRGFIKEAKILASFSHSALLEVFRFWEGNGTAYIAMRLYRGETLRQAISKDKSKFDEDTIAQIMGPIMDAIEMLHREQVFHRDIAPDNIMLANGQSVLLDFGSARRVIGDATQALTTILKPGYSPLEQYSDDGTMRQGAWTDVYALGGVLYHLATGKVPPQAVSRLLADPLQSVNQVTNNAFSDAFSSAVTKALSVYVENRFQTVVEFREALGWSVAAQPRTVTLSTVQIEAESAPEVILPNSVPTTAEEVPAGTPVPPPTGTTSKLAASGKRQTNPNTRNPVILGIVLVLLLVGAIAWFFSKDRASPQSPASSSTWSPTSPAAQTLLRFHGSNTIGGKLLPALAEAFLKQEGYANIHQLPGAKEEEVFVVGEKNGAETRVDIQAHGSGTAFKNLKDSLCDIGMSSRPIKPEEQQALAPTLGELTANTGEHVLALDGIALIVHQSNPIKTLSVTQLADIFSGKLTEWSQLGGRTGAIVLYARDDKSGTFDFFNAAVLKAHGSALAANAKRFEDSNKLSAGVSEDPAGIGFIGLNYIGSNKVLGLSSAGVESRKPSLLTVKTEDYILSRRLFLYAADKPSNPNVSKFIEYAMSAAGQRVIAAVGLVNLDVTPLSQAQIDDPRLQSAQWKKLTAGAIELPTRFRFNANSNELDNRANRDIGRIVYILAQPAYKGKEAILVGFTDSAGSAKLNLELSQSRAEIVRKVLTEEGVKIQRTEGIGAEAFVAPNDTDENKQKNRRVEVWLK